MTLRQSNVSKASGPWHGAEAEPEVEVKVESSRFGTADRRWSGRAASSGASALHYVRHTYGRIRHWLGLGPADPKALLSSYRQLALQIARGHPGKGSTLLASPVSSEHVPECCALLAAGLASLLRKPVLLVDISEEGRRLPNLMGLTSEMYCTTDERSRFFSVSGRWYVATREGVPLGPYRSVVEAEAALCQFIHAPSWVVDAKAEQLSPQDVTLPTYFQHLFFLPSGPARQALVRASYLGETAEHIGGLIDGFHQHFSHVLFYGGPVKDNPLMLSVVPHVDELVHAVVENETRVSDVQASQDILQGYRLQQVPFVLIRKTRRAASLGM